MSTQPKLRVPKLRTYLNLIATRIVRETAPLTGIGLLDPAEARFDAPPDTGAWKSAAIGDFWGAKQHYACFKATATIPAHWPTDGLEIRMEHEARFLEPTRMIADTFPAGPEGQLFINGRRAGAIDAQHHRIRYAFQPGKTYDVRAVFFAARCECRHALKQWELTWIDTATEKLAYDLTVALDVVEQLDPASVAREHLLRAVEAAVQAVDLRETTDALALPTERRRDPAGELFYASLPAAQAAFDKAMTKVPPAGDVPAIVLVGHAHIDLAWLWPFAVAQHKCVRTFGTQVRLLEQYPDWVFQQSSAQAYAWIERSAPDLFEQIRQHVAAGRWEADGATWVEMDTNLVGGESLVRQFVYGKRYFREKFGTDSRMLWLPDVFGYSAALPQIMRLAGVDGFVTQKLNWNQTNRFPHHTFRWRGLDGTETLSHFPVGTYNAMTTDAPIAEIKDSWDRYEQKAELLDPVLPFGWGDGGGGPTEKMIEMARRLAASPVAGMPKVRLEKAGDVLRRLLPHVDRLPVWDGELYLEYHRGTYTSQAWLKRANRKNEVRLHNLEWLAAVARPHGFTLDKARIDQVWQDLLLMQFHDVLPGSSVGEVYDEVREMQGRVASEADAMCANATALLCLKIDTSACSEPVVLFNTLAWSRREPVQLPDGTWRDDITVPASGWAVVDAAKPVTSSAESSLTFSQDGRTLGNRYWRLQLDAQGRLMELYDRINDRQVLPVGAIANEWQVFEDRPLDFDAWDIDAYYQEHPLLAPTCERVEVVERGPVRVAVELTWRMPLIHRGPQSTIVQRIALYANDPRIDFETKADWHDHHQLLKVAFPVDIRAT
ncbi:MAG: alpha-mannosidase, partial [Phycisphaerae bacterium]|nr:alpha-mannosidase [Phycisphaerae bacterium]